MLDFTILLKFRTLKSLFTLFCEKKNLLMILQKNLLHLISNLILCQIVKVEVSHLAEASSFNNLSLWCRSIWRGGSIAIFMFGYAIYFYAKSNMRGFLQLSFFFGYNACICYAFFLMLGTISFRALLLFVQYIYRSVKNEWSRLCIFGDSFFFVYLPTQCSEWRKVYITIAVSGSWIYRRIHEIMS